MEIRMNKTIDPGVRVEQHRITRLRADMLRVGLTAIIVPSSDPHLSEYPPAHWQGRAWLSGFTGSVGTLVVTAEFAGLWVDSRYWGQAEAQLMGTGIDVMKLLPGQAHPHLDWLLVNLPSGAVVGVDGAVLSLSAAQTMSTLLTQNGITLQTDGDPLIRVWEERPALPVQAVFEHLPPYMAASRASKLAAIRCDMAAVSADWHLLVTLDDIAWIFNLRGADVPYNPVFVAFALLGLNDAVLFIEREKVPETVLASLSADGVRLLPYGALPETLAALPASSRLLVDPRRMTHGLLKGARATQDRPSGAIELVEAVNPSTLKKSRKTPSDAANLRTTMEQDGAALCEFFAWFEARLAADDDTLTELTVDVELHAARARRPGFVCESFATIAGFNANGAMPHYRATPEAHAAIRGNGLLLIDSGGQYVGGTTDITRVVPVGVPSNAQKQDFTTVLKGTIALSMARFPTAIRSPMLDAIARAPLWAEGLDYGHGTGHGVGYFLNVHEGPQVISYYAAPEAATAMEEGMITSIEPGVYRPGQWGIRIENLVLNRRVSAASDASDAPNVSNTSVNAGAAGFGEFLEFETLTLCPIDSRCIVLSRLDSRERAWLNAYHQTVRERLSPCVDGAARTWLETRTQPI